MAWWESTHGPWCCPTRTAPCPAAGPPAPAGAASAAIPRPGRRAAGSRLVVRAGATSSNCWFPRKRHRVTQRYKPGVRASEQTRQPWAHNVDLSPGFSTAQAPVAPRGLKARPRHAVTSKEPHVTHLHTRTLSLESPRHRPHRRGGPHAGGLRRALPELRPAGGASRPGHGLHLPQPAGTHAGLPPPQQRAAVPGRRAVGARRDGRHRTALLDRARRGAWTARQPTCPAR
jgi:hypothetical protein